MILKGTIAWAKILGKPTKNYAGDGEEWTVDFAPDEAGIKALTEAGVAEKIKPVEDSKGRTHVLGAPYVKFSKPSVTSKGLPNKPFIVVDKYGEPWDDEVLLGNGTKVSIIVTIAEGEKPKPWIKPYLTKVRVDELVPYGEDFDDYETPAEDDEIPF